MIAPTTAKKLKKRRQQARTPREASAGFVPIPNTWIRQHDERGPIPSVLSYITGNQLKVLIAIQSYPPQPQGYSVSQGNIGRWTGLSQSQVSRAINGLISMGLLQRTSEGIGCKRRSYYRISTEYCTGGTLNHAPEDDYPSPPACLNHAPEDIESCCDAYKSDSSIQTPVSHTTTTTTADAVGPVLSWLEGFGFGPKARKTLAATIIAEHADDADEWLDRCVKLMDLKDGSGELVCDRLAFMRHCIENGADFTALDRYEEAQEAERRAFRGPQRPCLPRP